jgi:tetratricopeptide (TPR) repeat protein
MKKKIPFGNPIKIICVIGLILALIISWGMVTAALTWGRKGKTQESSFVRDLSEYDLFNATKKALEGENPEQIESRLSQLQKKVGSVEEQLSVLKRRRALAQIDRRYIQPYTEAARKAAETFPFSVPVAAVAAEAFVLGENQSAESLALLRDYASRITQNRFDQLFLGLQILSGAFENPASALDLPPELLSLELPGFSEQTRRALLIDDFLLRSYKRDVPAAAQKLNALLDGASPEILRMGADFFYDHQNPLKAAELFILLGGEAELVKAADALVLAGDIPAARNIWLALYSEQRPMDFRFIQADNPALQTLLRNSYNLAATSQDKAEEMSWLEKMFSVMAQQGSSQIQGGPVGRFDTYSVIRYSRLLDEAYGIAVLEDFAENPQLDLELFRRRYTAWPLKRAASELWLLLSRHGENEALYEWAAWYFDHQRLYDETGRLLKEASRKGMDGAWLDLHSGLALIREGKITEGEKLLKETRFQDWRIYANLGRIQENRRAISAALDSYETAATLVREKTAAARVQMRISRCLEALDRIDESRRALEFALELDSDNINIRRELRRINNR